MNYLQKSLRSFHLRQILSSTLMLRSLVLAGWIVTLSTSSANEDGFQFEESAVVPLTHLTLVSPVGSTTEPEARQGLTNLAAQWLLHGTKHHNKLSFFERLESLGAHIEVGVKGEATLFQVNMLTQNLEATLALVTEMMTEPALSVKELRKLKSESLGKIHESQGHDVEIARRAFQKFFYQGHPYAQNSDGTIRGISSSSEEEAKARVHLIQSKGFALFGSGDGDREEIQTWFQQLHEKLGAKPADLTQPTVQTPPQISSKPHIFIINRPHATQSQVLIGGPGIRPEEEGFYFSQIANFAFGGPSFGSTLLQELRVKRGWTYGASNSFSFGRQPRHFVTYFFPKTSDTVPGIELAFSLLNRLGQEGVSKEDFERARHALVAKAPFLLDTPRKRLENLVVERLNGFPPGYHNRLPENLRTTPYESPSSVLKRLFVPRAYQVVIVGQAKELLTQLKAHPEWGSVSVHELPSIY